MEGFSALPEIMLAEDNPKKRAGRKKFKETRHPVYRGIRQRNLHKWVCETREPNKKTRIWLGTFPTAEMAARAYDVAAIALRGRTACLNFADSAWRLPLPASTDTKDIQRAAAEAAEMFRHPHAPAQSSSASAPTEEENNMGWMDEYLSGMPDLFADPAPAEAVAPAPPEETGDMTTWMEEDAFGMPENIVADMYNGMMLPPSPPPAPPPPDYTQLEDDDYVDLPLWNF